MEKFDDTFSCLDRIPACDGRRDRRTDILLRHNPRYAHASRGKNAIFTIGQHSNSSFCYQFHTTVLSGSFRAVSANETEVAKMYKIFEIVDNRLAFCDHINFTVSQRHVRAMQIWRCVCTRMFIIDYRLLSLRMHDRMLNIIVQYSLQ